MNLEKLSQQIEIENILNKSVGETLELLNRVPADPLILKVLSKNEDWHVRLTVAGNPNTAPETLKKLAQDKDCDVRRAAAENLRNLNTDLETLKKLAEDENWLVRRAVARNLNTDPETLKKLAEDKDWGVRFAVAKNPNTDYETLQDLAEDKDEIVREAVKL